jgi:NitT/TauT family transport system ATP-binding protein
MLELELQGVAKSFDDHLAIEGVDLSVPAGSLGVVVGPSGCGKSTLLDLAAGLTEPDSGRITLGGEEVTGPGPETAIVFQDGSLFPWLTVRDNVAFGMKASGRSRRDRHQAADRLLGQVGLEAWAGHRPHQLSGGMRQRVALARALAVRPEIILLDEPFGALDYQTRKLMQQYLLALREREKTTVLLVTHDLDEAVTLGDSIFVLSGSPGQVVEAVEVDLPRPRVSDDADFRRLRRHLEGHLIRETAETEFTVGERELLHLGAS